MLRRRQKCRSDWRKRKALGACKTRYAMPSNGANMIFARVDAIRREDSRPRITTPRTHPIKPSALISIVRIAAPASIVRRRKGPLRRRQECQPTAKFHHRPALVASSPTQRRIRSGSNPARRGAAREPRSISRTKPALTTQIAQLFSGEKALALARAATSSQHSATSVCEKQSDPSRLRKRATEK